MKKLLSTALLALTLIGTIQADLGVPTIQAICKVTLKDGKAIEGIITFGPGGYEYNYKPHGFCFVYDKGGNHLRLYDFSFNRFVPDNNGDFRRGESKLYYAENVSKQWFPETTIEFDEKEKIITETTTDEDKYKLLDEMVMYKKLPLSLFVGFSRNNEDAKITINVSEIKSVEILRNPGKTWLELIGNAREKINDRIGADIKENEDAWIDYMEPSWYHEIIKDEEQVNYLKQFF